MTPAEFQTLRIAQSPGNIPIYNPLHTLCSFDPCFDSVLIVSSQIFYQVRTYILCFYDIFQTNNINL
jgi:hypothetical protein